MSHQTWLLHWVLVPLFLVPSQGRCETDLRDYGLYDHRVYLNYLRAGNHDPEGKNQYQFEVVLRAYRNTSSDHSIPIDERPNWQGEKMVFGDVELEPLKIWQGPEGDPEMVHADISGEEIRQLIVEGMRDHKLKESDIAVLAEVSLIEKGKYLWFFGEDTLVQKTRYFPIPSSPQQAGERVNVFVSMKDLQGLDLKMNVKYQNPLEKKPPSVQPSPTPSVLVPQEINP